MRQRSANSRSSSLAWKTDLRSVPGAGGSAAPRRGLENGGRTTFERAARAVEGWASLRGSRTQAGRARVVAGGGAARRAHHERGPEGGEGAFEAGVLRGVVVVHDERGGHAAHRRLEKLEIEGVGGHERSLQAACGPADEAAESGSLVGMSAGVRAVQQRFPVVPARLRGSGAGKHVF